MEFDVFLVFSQLQIDKEIVLLSVLKEPVSRSIFDYALRSKDIGSLFRTLQLRQKKRSGVLSDCPPPEDPAIAQLLKKLLSQVSIFQYHNSKARQNLWSHKDMNHGSSCATFR